MEIGKLRRRAVDGLVSLWNPRAFRFAAFITLAVLILEFFLFQKYQAAFLQRITNPDSGSIRLDAMFVLVSPYITAAALLLGSVYCSLISSFFLRPVYFAYFAAATFYEFTYQLLFNRFSISQDLALVFITTNTQRYDAVESYANLYALIPCIIYLAVLVAYRRTTLSVRKSFGVLIAIVTIFCAFNLVMWFKAPKYYFYEAWSNSFVAATRSLAGYTFAEVAFHDVEREKVPGLDSQPTNNVVLVIDESVRGDHLSVNGYERETTPFLDELARRGSLLTWGVAAAASTRSEDSFSHIVTGLTPTEDVEIWELAKVRPSLCQYAQEANYRTYYFDGQLDDYWAANKNDLDDIDAFLGAKYFDPNGDDPVDVDRRIAAKTREIVSASTGNFIVIFKRGNHRPYNLNFPAGGEIWQPSLRSFVDERNDDLQTYINTYDNGLRYNIDAFFRSLLKGDQTLPHTVVLYTSDHGQTLSEAGEIYTHGGDSVREAAVPLIVIGDLASVPDTGFKAMHANIFATLLDLMNYPEALRKHQYAVSLLKATSADSRERYYMTPHFVPGGRSVVTNSRRKFD